MENSAALEEALAQVREWTAQANQLRILNDEKANTINRLEEPPTDDQAQRVVSIMLKWADSDGAEYTTAQAITDLKQVLFAREEKP